MNSETENKPRLLIVDDEKPTRDGLRAALEGHYEVWVAEDAKAAMTLLEEENFQVLLTDFRLPQEDGMKLILRAKSLARPPICILMTAYGSEELAVQAMKEGADDYIAKGRLQIDELEMRISRALRQQHLEVENARPAPATQRQVRAGKRRGRVPGHEGGGRHGPAGRPHAGQRPAPGRKRHGQGADGPRHSSTQPARLASRWSACHCAALSPTLLESELFGHEKGAFTGAHEKRIGRFEQAQGGTLFLDEIGEIDATVQVKLLRFLGERTFERVGSNKTLTADVRLIAATNKNLQEEVEAGQIPRRPLFSAAGRRDHPAPIAPAGGRHPAAGQAFLREFASENNKKVNDFTPDALEALMNYAWPGNVRELRTAIEHAVVLSRGDRIGLRDLPPALRARQSRGRSGPLAGPAGPDGGGGGEAIDHPRPQRGRRQPHAGGARNWA